MSVIDDIAAERRRQIEVEGYDTAHDDAHDGGELAQAAAAYALVTTKEGFPSMVREIWPWQWHQFYPKNLRSDLVRAAALIVAEIERLDRVASKASAS